MKKQMPANLNIFKNVAAALKPTCGLSLEFLSADSLDGFQEFVLEHARHHASTVDLLMQGEFGWDPEDWNILECSERC